MTTAQTMLKSAPRHAGAALSLCLSSLLALSGCTPQDKLIQPSALIAPYDASHGEPLWAVVPLRNESGTSAADAWEISDKVVAAASQVKGLRTVPLNRTLAAMRSLNMTELASPADARLLAQEMGVDGLIVGSITAYDPYNPPKLGLALALYARSGSLGQIGQQAIDPKSLRYQPTDYQYFPRTTYTDAPTAVISDYLDGKNQAVQTDLRAYAKGRHDPAAALAWRRYLSSMDLYSEFAAWQAVGHLIDHEWLRLSGALPNRDKKK